MFNGDGPLSGNIKILGTVLEDANKAIKDAAKAAVKAMDLNLTQHNDNSNIRFATPDVGLMESSDVMSVINTKWLTNGPTVREFEKRIADVSKTDRAVAYDSCTGAMEMALRALGVGKGDEVITTPYTYTSTAEVIRNVGAKIVFVDLDGVSFEMDYEKVAAAITEKTKAVIPVDIGGKMCNYESLIAAVLSKIDIFKPKNTIQKAIGRVAIVADAAHSFGATMKGKASGELADFTCFSFHVLKNITTGGEGGAVVWKNIEGIDNDELETKLRLLGDHGQTSRDKSKGWEYDIALFGYNSIMTNIDAAMGIAQLDRLDEIVGRRMEVTARYDSLFRTLDFGDGCNRVTPLIEHFAPTYTSAMHLYPIRLEVHSEEKTIEEIRNEMYFALRDAGIPCNVHYKPLPMMTAYKRAGYSIDDYPNAYDMFRSLLTIPYHTELTMGQQQYIVSEIEKAVKKYE